MKIVFATNNQHKLQEIKAAIGNLHEIVSLKDIGFEGDIPETHDTLAGNASEKSHYIFERYGLNCFADDTGLEIEALDGAPGVYSARYAGEKPSFDDNMNKVLTEMQNKTNRKAVFKTIISLIIDGQEYQFEGACPGTIMTEKYGEEGFGYDPIFMPDGFQETFAELPLEIKNQISHRGLATKKLIAFLKNQ
ncbi:MAG: non-canonical purine NTP diphosphatase [Bacteroidales bacterium]|nr:non-canonical purine NTP diphosphatase [Bacteroidales bacterium]